MPSVPAGGWPRGGRRGPCGSGSGLPAAFRVGASGQRYPQLDGPRCPRPWGSASEMAGAGGLGLEGALFPPFLCTDCTGPGVFPAGFQGPTCLHKQSRVEVYLKPGPFLQQPGLRAPGEPHGSPCLSAGHRGDVPWVITPASLDLRLGFGFVGSIVFFPGLSCPPADMRCSGRLSARLLTVASGPRAAGCGGRTPDPGSCRVSPTVPGGGRSCRGPCRELGAEQRQEGVTVSEHRCS